MAAQAASTSGEVGHLHTMEGGWGGKLGNEHASCQQRKETEDSAEQPSIYLLNVSIQAGDASGA